MGNYKQEVKSALGEIFNEMGVVVTYRGKTYTCTVAAGQNALELESGGFVPDGNFNIKFLESELGANRPAVGDTVNYNGDEYRVIWVSNRSGRGQVEVQVQPRDK
jgi:hypothetical protein